MTVDPATQLSQAADAFATALDEHAGALHALRTAIRQEAHKARGAGQAQLNAALKALPPPALAAWSEAAVWKAAGGRPAWLASAGLEPVAVRVGQLRPTATGSSVPSVPAVLDILGAGHIAMVERGHGNPQPEQLQGIILRTLASARAGSAELWVVDARGHGAISAPFTPLLSTGGRSIASSVAKDERSIERLMAELSDLLLDVQSNVLQGRYRSLAEFYAATKRATIPRRLLVVNGFPFGFNRASAGNLESILRNGAASGIHVLVTVDPATPVPHDVNVQTVLSGATAVTEATATNWTTPVLPGCTISLDDGPPRQVLLDAVRIIAGAAQASASASLPLAPTLPADAQFWKSSSADGLSTAVGYDAKGDEVPWEVSDKGPEWATFIAGTAGSGKSNLIHTLITGLAARYPPAELEMYLLDFKQGVELWQYGPAASTDWLPHVKLVARATDRELGVDVLIRLNAELDARLAEYSRMGLRENTYSGYRAAGGRRGRTLVVLDEFQDLLLPADVLGDAAIAQLTRLARLGRAGGFHLVLATQTLNGLGEIAGKLKGILDQLTVRFALKLDPDMSREVLSGHPDASTLSKRGQAIFQLGIGSDRRRVDVLHAEGATLVSVRQASAKRRDPRTPTPTAFDGDLVASLDDLDVAGPALGAALVGAQTLECVLGLPVAIGAPATVGLRPDLGQHILVAGSGRAVAEGVLQAIALSMAAGSAPGRTQFLLLDAVPGRSGLAEALKVGLPAFGANVLHIVDGILLRRHLKRLSSLPASGRPMGRVVLLAVDMDVFSVMGVDGEELADVLKMGPLRGLHAVLPFSSLAGPDQQLGYGFLDAHAHHRILLNASRDEQLSTAFLPLVPPERGTGKVRIDWWTRDAPTDVTRLIPPTALDKTQMAAWIAAKNLAGWRTAGGVG